ncbi:MAG: UPF0098 protein [Phycisphaerae bacterium]
MAQATSTITVQSTAFQNNRQIPRQHTGDGRNISPALSWSGIPAGAKELALIVDDPDAPRPEPWVHWLVYKIPADIKCLREELPPAEHVSSPAGALQGKNSWGGTGYRGPEPPRGHGIHHYHFKVYALDTKLRTPPGADKATLLAAMEGHVLAEGELIGTYER